MSTKTTFKRIALVAVAALGLGVLSVAPSQATVSNLSVTVTNGTAGVNGAATDSTTGALIAVSALLDSGKADTVTVSFVADGTTTDPATSVVAPRLVITETTTSVSSFVDNTLPGTSTAASYSATESVTSGNVYSISSTGTSSTYVGAKFRLFLESVSSTSRVAGTYNYSIIVKQYSAGVAAPVTTTYPAVITITAPTSASKVASAAYSTLGDPSNLTSVATASTTNTAAATLALQLKNASDNAAARESVTATISGPGTIGDGTVNGKSVVLKYNSDSGLTLNVYADGTAGTSTITVTTPSVTFPTKSITFFAKSPKTITASVNNPVLNVGTNGSAVVATAVDANGIAWTGSLYIKAVAAADALIGGSATDPVGCTWTASVSAHVCPITTLAIGTASFVVVDETLDTDGTYAAADSAATSNTVSVTVSGGTPTTVKLAFDKSSYAPYEKAIITVTPLDAAGKTMGTKTITNLFATGGITSNQAFASGSDTLTAVTLTTSADSSAAAPRTAGAYTYVVYMPALG